MQEQTTILIIGGGLAGLTTALHLQKAGIDTILIEKLAYPHHKVCGEYMSNEVLPYLQWLEVDPLLLGAPQINELQFTTVNGHHLQARLPLGGFGVSRYTIDHHLYTSYLKRGGHFIHDTVTDVSYDNDEFTISTQDGLTITARYVVGAYGKRSALDNKLNRKHPDRRSPFLAVKGHYSGDVPGHVVSLHNFHGGYCGVSKVEDNKINVCYLTDYRSFKCYKDIPRFQEEVLNQNRYLKRLFDNTKSLFDAPLTISQIDFGPRNLVDDHVLMVGDTAGLIHPLCGNGMSMAIHGAKICAELLIASLQGNFPDRATLERVYIKSWRSEFRSRLRMGTALSSILQKERLTALILKGMVYVPSLLPLIIRKTHGRSLTVTV